MTASITPQLVEPEGLLHVHTASHRGSYAHVLSQALRAAGLGSRVLIAQFLKGGVQQGPDHALHLCGRLQWLRPSVPGCLSGVKQDPAHRQVVQEKYRETLLSYGFTQALSDRYDTCKRSAGQLLPR